MCRALLYLGIRVVNSMRGFAQPLLESGRRGVVWEAVGFAEGGAAEDGAAGEATASSSKIKRVAGSESGGQQKRTLGASWDIRLGAKLRSAAKCGAYYQVR